MSALESDFTSPLKDPIVGTSSADDSGTATAGGASTLSDSTKAWEVNWWTGGLIKILAGKGAGQFRKIASNTATQITVSTAWTTAPDETSQYVIESDWSSATDADASTNPSLQGVGMMIFDNSNYRRVRSFNNDNLPSNNLLAAGRMLRSDQGAVNDRDRMDIGQRQVGTANTQLQFTQITYNTKALAIILQASGGVGVFASQTMTIEVSVDGGTNWITVDSVNLGTAATKGVYYDDTHLAATIPVNPANFRTVRITVPACGASVVVTATVAGK